MELFISEPDGNTAKFKLEKQSISLGRAPGNDLIYPNDPWLSRYHLQFERRTDGWFVGDRESRNGTVVNATTIRETRRINAGDRIYAGHLVIEVHDIARSHDSTVSFVPETALGADSRLTHVTNLTHVLEQSSFGAPSEQPVQGQPRAVQALIRAGQELAGHRPLDEVFGVILDLTLSAVGATRGVILTVEGDELLLRASNGREFSISTTVRDRVLSERSSLMIRDAQFHSDFRGQKSIVAQDVRSMMAVPLQTQERVIGLIYVDKGARMQPFAQEDLDLLTVMANVAAIRIEHARLLAIEQSEKLMEAELTQASEIQQNLLPEAMPSYEDYDVAGFQSPCHAVGGDYYDFIPYKDGRLCLTVGDVAGKGLAAALLMASLQARVHMLVETMPDPAEALATLNRHVAARCPPGRFITLFYGILNPSTGHLQYASAGHNFPLLIRKDGTFERLKGNGMVLGILASVDYQTVDVPLQSGDLIALFSDGVTEARQPDTLVEFGDERLAAFLLARREEQLPDLIEALASHVREWCGLPSFADDFTVLLLRRR